MILQSTIAILLDQIGEFLWTHHNIWLIILSIVLGSSLLLRCSALGQIALVGTQWHIAAVCCISIIHCLMLYGGEAAIIKMEYGVFMLDEFDEIKNSEVRRAKHMLSETKLIGNTLLYCTHALLLLRMRRDCIPQALRQPTKMNERTNESV
jgi:hypothetical protein